MALHQRTMKTADSGRRTDLVGQNVHEEKHDGNNGIKFVIETNVPLKVEDEIEDDVHMKHVDTEEDTEEIIDAFGKFRVRLQEEY